jgi:cephalosporin hydroxylase
MTPLQAQYVAAVSTPSDINEHLPTLFTLANECDHVTEFGVRWGASTTAFLASKARLVSYDIDQHPAALHLFELAREEGKAAEFKIGNTLKIERIFETDMLFIDTLHTYAQLRHELFTFHSSVGKYIALHDTVTFGEKGEDGGPGLIPAIWDFLTTSPEWRIKEHHTNNNGLTVLERA